MNIGSRLREAREALGLSQTEFGRIGGVGKTTVLAWEHGTAFPNAAFLEAIAQLGADVRYVVTGSRDYTPPDPLTTEEQALLERWRAASRETKNAAMGALLGVSAAARTKMTFKREVMNVIEGDATIRDVVIHQAGTPYRVTPKAAPKKAPKKP